jgi:hypothetical protein
MTTVTTVTFKRIKEYVLALKKRPDRLSVLVHPAELRQQLQDTDADWQFSDAEMMTAVRHLICFRAHNICFRETLGADALLIFPT